MKISRDIIPRSLSRWFYLYGKFLAKYPLPFLLIPLFLTLLLSIGMIRYEVYTDAEYLYVPMNAPSLDERDYIDNTFSSDAKSSFTPLRQNDVYNGYLIIHIQEEDESNLYNDDISDSLLQLNAIVLNEVVKFKGELKRYEDICATWEGKCSYPSVIQILNSTGSFYNSNLTFPIYVTTNGLQINLVTELGRVNTNTEGYVTSIKGIALQYFVSYTTHQDPLAQSWLHHVTDKLNSVKIKNIEITATNAQSMEDELEKIIDVALPRFTISFLTIGIFAIGTCMMLDWVRSKPWIAMAGLVAAFMGITSSYGLLIGVGVKFASICILMGFLIVGIGVDDMFILIAAWRTTSVRLCTEERMAQSLQSSAVSITITSVTDIMAFAIGCLTPFRSITLFCAYAGLATFFVYLYMITFTSACMVFSGRREARNQHPLACKQVLPKAQAGDKSRAYQWFCASGDIQENKTQETQDPTNLPKEEQSSDENKSIPFLNRFFGTKFADFVLTTPVKVAIVIVYLAMLAGAIYGLVGMDQGLSLEHLVPDNSFYRTFVQRYRRDFEKSYGPVIMIAITEPLDYTKHSTDADIDKLIEEFRKNKYFMEEDWSMLSWYHNFDAFLLQQNINKSTLNMEQFIDILQNNFLTLSQFSEHKLDIALNAANSSIKASRMYIQSEPVPTAVEQTNMMLEARKLAEKSTISCLVNNRNFVFYDNFAIILDVTLQNLGIAVVSMMIVSIIFIPSITTVICVTLATLSICIFCVGYMALWDVSLDTLSFTNLVINIGFSVDFAAHISYHYVISPDKNPNDKAKSALLHLGGPIFQGATSSLLAVLTLATSASYPTRTFFKLVFLEMVFGFYHAMFLLPVTLSTVDQLYQKCRRKSKDIDSPAQNGSVVNYGFDSNETFDKYGQKANNQFDSLHRDQGVESISGNFSDMESTVSGANLNSRYATIVSISSENVMVHNVSGGEISSTEVYD